MSHEYFWNNLTFKMYFNAFYVRTNLDGGMVDLLPAICSEGGFSADSIWYVNAKNRRILRTYSEIKSFCSTPIGSFLPLRDIVYLNLSINKSEDPLDGEIIISLCVCCAAYKILEKNLIPEIKLSAADSKKEKEIANFFVRNKLGGNYKEYLHHWLRLKNQ